MQIAEAGSSKPNAIRPAIEINDVTENLGAEVIGVDVRDDAAVDAFWDRMQALLRDRYLIIFRDQQIDAPTLERFARRFGELEVSYTQRPDGSNPPPVNTITNLDKDGKPSKRPSAIANYYWHSDRANFANGSAMVMLHGQQLPPNGGDTQFADMMKAYDALSVADKVLAGRLTAVHSFEHKLTTIDKRALTDLERKTVPKPSVHPLVRTNPQTGRKNLFLGMYACEIPGMPQEEARALLDRLQDHGTSEEFVYTHKWRKGDFIIWDNLCMLHRALRNYEMEASVRVMLRCGIKSNRAIQ